MKSLDFEHTSHYLLFSQKTDKTNIIIGIIVVTNILKFHKYSMYMMRL